ncbi:unnamed protein product [Lota lota]
MHPHLRDGEARVIENVIRLAIDSIITVLAGVDCARTREHERLLAERDGELKRLSSREKQLERELQVLRRQGSGNGGLLDGAHVDHCSVFSDQPPCTESSDPWPGCDEGDEARRGQREIRFSLGFLTTSPSQVSTPNQYLATPSPAKKSAFLQPVVPQPPEVVDTVEVRPILLDIPVIKEEPPNMEAACEVTDLHALAPPPPTPDLDAAPARRGGGGDEDACSSGDSGEGEGHPGAECRPSSPESDGPNTNHAWHHRFQIPWNKMSTNVKKRLKSGERPSAGERREVVRVIAGELLATCRAAGKAHVLEIARRVALAHPKSFQDEMAGEVVGSGYDSIVRQMMSHIYNVRRPESPRAGKRPGAGGGGGGAGRDAAGAKRRRRDAYGCVNPEPALPAGETAATQQSRMEELQLMSRTGDADAEKMEALMTVTFASQRKDISSAATDTRGLLERWPYLFRAAGMRIHVGELTGARLSGSFGDTAATKFRRILAYFRGLPADPLGGAGDLVVQTQTGSDPTCGAVLMLLAHFNERQDTMFVRVDAAARPSDVDAAAAALPWTPCVAVCGRTRIRIWTRITPPHPYIGVMRGECPLKATAYVVAVDQVAVSERLSTFGEALHVMFYSYYIHNMDYPAEICATMEFLQRCIFKINPDQGSKVGKQGGAHRVLMNPKVLNLLSRMFLSTWGRRVNGRIPTKCLQPSTMSSPDATRAYVTHAIGD